MKPIRTAIALVVSAVLSLAGVPGALATDASARDTRSLAAAPAPGPSSAAVSKTADDSVIVRFRGGLTGEKLRAVYRSADTSAGAVDIIRGDVLEWDVPAGSTPAEFAEQLEGTGDILYAEPNYIRQIVGYTPPAYETPNDPAYTDKYTWQYGPQDDPLEVYPRAMSWWIRDVTAIQAWQKGYTGSNISGKYPLRADGDTMKVGVIDTGAYFDHPDAGENLIAGSADAAPVDPSYAPGSTYASKVGYVAHGTCTAGLIGATVNNGIGTLGVAGDTKVAMYKVYYGGDGIQDAHLISAIREAADDGCRVISMSIAGTHNSTAVQDAIDYAWSRGCVIVAASGNAGVGQVYYPAAMNHVVAVGALYKNGSGETKLAPFSNYGSQQDLTAPGTFIWGLTKPGFTADSNSEPGYTWWDGTSMAAPIVAGGMALVWRAMPDLSNRELISLVQGTATDLGASGRDNRYGYGELNMNAAYARLISDYPLLRTPRLSVLSEHNARNIRVQWTAVSGDDVTYEVLVDGAILASDLTSTAITLPRDTSVAPHEITVSAMSPRNWADGAATDSVIVNPTMNGPEITSFAYQRGTLRWKTTESDRPHTTTLSIDGAPAAAITEESTLVALPIGQHHAVLTLQDDEGNASEPATLAFTVRPAPSIKRVTGGDRYSYATTLSRYTFSEATTAVLVGGGSWADAFAAAPLAHIVGGPVLPTSRYSLPSATKTELARLRVTDVIIVGNTSDVSTKLRRSLGRTYAVSRISGDDRYQTANAVAREIARRGGGSVADDRVVVVGDSFAAALGGSAVAARAGWPLLYSKRSYVPSATRATLASIGATRTLIVGSTSSVSTDARRQLPDTTRISGSSGPAVLTALASWATANRPDDFSGERVYLANSTSWAAALGLPAASAEKGGVVLVTPTSLASSVKSYFRTNSEIAVTTRVTASRSGVSSSAYGTIRSIVGAP